MNPIGWRARLTLSGALALAGWGAPVTAAADSSVYTLAVVAEAVYGIVPENRQGLYTFCQRRPPTTACPRSLYARWKRHTPGAFTTIASLTTLSGIQAAVLEHRKDHRIVIAFAGTNGKDGYDLATDAALVAFRTPARAYLDIQKDAVLKFIDYVPSIRKTTGQRIRLSEVELVGHSLGGYLVQIVAANRKIGRAVTFNAPGASGYLGARSNSRRYLNFIRKSDIVGNNGRHYGPTIVYPNARKSNPANNHAIRLLRKNIKSGLKPFARARYLRQKLVGLANRCMHVLAPLGKGKNARLVACDGDYNQRWTLDLNGLIRISSRNGKREYCLEGKGGGRKRGEIVEIRGCHGLASQIWTYAGGLIKSRGGKCLDVKGAKPGLLAQLILWDCHGRANQRWAFRR